MKNFLDKYISGILLTSNLLVFLLYTLVMPHTSFMFNFVNVGIFILLFAPLTTLLIILFKKTWRQPKSPSFYYDRAFNILSLINLFLFVFTLPSLTPLLSGDRAALALIYIIFFSLVYLLNLLEVCFSLGYFEKLFKNKADQVKAKDENKALVADARRARIDEVRSTRRFFLLFTTIIALIFFMYPLFSQNFTVPLGGDYTQQQIPFYTNGYDDWWHFLTTGQFPLWDHNTFLGVNNVGSNSFYYAFNPFFFPILVFPRDLIPQGLAILMIGKFVLAAVTMRLYLKYMGVAEKEARFFAIIFAFSGWNVYYLWFNHFMEVAVIFPLIFLGIEKVLKEKKIRLLIFSLALMGFANYFFLMTVLVLGFLYAMIRYIQLLPKIEPTVIGLGLIAFVLGTLMSSVILFPSLLIALNSDRVTDATYLDNLLAAFKSENFKLAWEIITRWEYQGTDFNVYDGLGSITYQGNTQDHKVYYPLISYFFPVLSNRSVALLNTSAYDNTISSLFSFSPVILLFFPAVFVSAKKGKISHLLIIALFLFAIFTPFAYNLLHGFTKEYGRWQLIVTFSLITYVATSLPDIKKEPAFVLDLSLLINLILMALTVQIAYGYENRNGFSLMYEREYIIVYQFATIFVTYLLYRLGHKGKNFAYYKEALLIVEIAVMGYATMMGHGIISYQNSVNGGLANYNDDRKALKLIQSADDSFYRIYNTNARHGHHNLAMRENYNGLSAFHSLYNFELMPFNSWSRVNASSATGWSLGLYERRGFLYDFLQVKYYMLNQYDSVINWVGGDKTYAPYKNVPNTYSFNPELSTDNRFVYEVLETFNFGFGVDNALSYESVNPNGSYSDLIASQSYLASVQNEALYLETALLGYEDHREIKTLYPHLTTKTYNSYPRINYTRLGSGSGLNVNYYDFTTADGITGNIYSYPFTAQLRSDGLLPTDAYVASYGTPRNRNELMYLNGAYQVIEYKASNGENLLDGPGEIVIDLPLSYADKGFRYNVFLYDENDNVITWDDHNSLPSYGTSWKVMRSFHSPVAVKKMTLIPIGERNIPPRNNIYVYDQSTIDTIRNKAISNSLVDVVFTNNEISFKTNYESEKFVVTTIPYDKGWSVKTSDGEALKVYRVQGGFVGFVSGDGETEYTMSYVPEYFNMGLALSLSALLITLLLELNIYVYKRHKRKKQELA